MTAILDFGKIMKKQAHRIAMERSGKQKKQQKSVKSSL